MPLRESPFPNGFIEALHTLGWMLVFPCFWFLDRLLAGCKSTTFERRRRRDEECYLHPLIVFLGSLFFLTLFLISAPVALLGFLLWAPLQFARRPFSYRQQDVTIKMQDRNAGWEETGKLAFGFVSGNLCLLPDGVARFNNLAHTQRRAIVVGKSIVQGVSRPHVRIFIDSPSSGSAMSPSFSLLPQADSTLYGTAEREGHQNASAAQDVDNPSPAGQPDMTGQAGAINRTSTEAPAACDRPEEPQEQPSVWNSNQSSNQQARRTQKPSAPMEVSTLFPANVDVVCLQEVFDKRASSRLAESLGPLFGHILYDVGLYACSARSAFKFFNSGLLVASRYPVMEAQYRCFPNGRGEDALAAKGLLSIKVQIGLMTEGKKMVGFFNCTHLHAPEGDGVIRCEQLDMLTMWINEFQCGTRQQDEMVVFDVLCGDFNFDNSSPDDHLEQNHSLFSDYIDPCRAGPGKEKPWVIGTLLQQPTLYDENMRTPENLQRTLEDEELRKLYLSRPIPLGDAPLNYPEPGEPWVGRRIDYLLYRESTLTEQCHTEVEDFVYVTQLAGLTDHIPVGLRINVSLDSEASER